MKISKIKRLGNYFLVIFTAIGAVSFTIAWGWGFLRILEESTEKEKGGNYGWKYKRLFSFVDEGIWNSKCTCIIQKKSIWKINLKTDFVERNIMQKIAVGVMAFDEISKITKK